MKANGARTKCKHINNFMGLFESSHMLKIPIISCYAITSHLPRTLLRNRAILRKWDCKKCTDYLIVRSIKPISFCLYRLYYVLFTIIYQLWVVEAASSSLVTQTKKALKNAVVQCFFVPFFTLLRNFGERVTQFATQICVMPCFFVTFQDMFFSSYFSLLNCSLLKGFLFGTNRPSL